MTNQLHETSNLPQEIVTCIIDHRCGHSDPHPVVLGNEAYVDCLEGHDCGVCALSDLQQGLILDKPLPELLDENLALVKRMEIFRVGVLASLVDICGTDQRYLAEHFVKWNIALQAIARRRAAAWWADLWSDPDLQPTYLIEQFASGTPRHPRFPRSADEPQGVVVSPALLEPYGPWDFAESVEDKEPRVERSDQLADEDDFEEVHARMLKDLRESWEMIKAGKGQERPRPQVDVTYYQLLERLIGALELEFAYIRGELAES